MTENIKNKKGLVDLCPTHKAYYPKLQNNKEFVLVIDSDVFSQKN